jgi:hypothetical protein
MFEFIIAAVLFLIIVELAENTEIRDALQPKPDANPFHLLALLPLALAADAAAAATLYSNRQWFASAHNLVTHPPSPSTTLVPSSMQPSSSPSASPSPNLQVLPLLPLCSCSSAPGVKSGVEIRCPPNFSKSAATKVERRKNSFSQLNRS